MAKTYNPTALDLLENAYSQLGIAPVQLKARAAEIGKQTIILLMNEWLTDFVPEWLKMDKTVFIRPNQLTYSNNTMPPDNPELGPDLPEGVDDIHAIYVTDGMGGSPREIYRYNDEDFLQYHLNNGDIESFPHGYKWERKIVPELVITPNPDTNYQAHCILVMKPNVVMDLLDEVEIPMRWQSAFVQGLAMKLVPHVNGSEAKLPALTAMYMDAYDKAYQSETEGVDTHFQPTVFTGLSGRSGPRWSF